MSLIYAVHVRSGQLPRTYAIRILYETSQSENQDSIHLVGILEPWENIRFRFIS